MAPKRLIACDTNVGNVAIFRQIVERIKFREKGMNALIGEIKLLNSTQSPCFIRPKIT